MNTYEIAKQIYEATDEEYMEVFAYLYKMVSAGEVVGAKLTAGDIRKVDLSELTSTIKDALEDIQLYSEDAWWNRKPNAYDLAIRLYDRTAWWDKGDYTVSDLMDAIENNPLEVINNMLDTLEG